MMTEGYLSHEELMEYYGDTDIDGVGSIGKS